MLDNPRRLSTDKDIIVDRSTDIEGFIDKAGTVFPFIRVDEQIRNGSNDIENRYSFRQGQGTGNNKTTAGLLESHTGDG
ncbi:MAG: hypothetical protein K5911_01965 [Eubacteriales bacterium]|nr:hypothetical protein [Eubacteriales bacterium]